MLRNNANLGYVSHIFPDTRAKYQPDRRLGRLMNCHERRFRIEDTAAGKPHDIVQEAHGTRAREVLIVDLGVDVVAIRSGNDACRSLIILLQPSPYSDLLRRIEYRRFQLGNVRESETKEQSAEAAKPICDEWG